MLIKRSSGPVFRLVAKPVYVTALFFIRVIGIPAYRGTFFLRRLFSRIVHPTKHRLLRVITNRYTVHVMMVVLIVGVVFVNFRTSDVRAETFGQRSILYALVAVDDSQTLEVVNAGDRVAQSGIATSYLPDTGLDARAHIDLNYREEAYVTPLTGETVSAPEVSKRDKVEMYVVQEGDTLGQIAQRFGLNLSTVLWSNDLTFRSTIRPGNSLKILPADGVLYTVKKGDTLSSISKRYGVETDKIQGENGLPQSEKLAIGDEILLTDAEPIVAPIVKRAPSVAKLFSPPSKSKKTEETEGTWVWPTDWHVITQYYGWRHTGIDIDGDFTTYSYAAREGVVIYSGWRGGYGVTVEIDHGDGYVTRYGHHSENYVKVGDVVTAGQILARTGTTGRSTGTHLHFEVIKNKKFQNPFDYIR